MEDDVVSIIVPVYNVERFLVQCIESILKQTYQQIEVLLVDDGSTDNSGVICDKYAEKDMRVKVIHQMNMGLSGARNTGIASASGKWISIVDGDDWLDRDAIEKLVSGVEEESDCDVYIGSFYASYPKQEHADSFFNQKRIVFTHDNMQLLQMSGLVMTSISKKKTVMNVGVTWARLYRTEFLKKNKLSFRVGLKRMQDATFHLYAYEYASKVVFVDIPIYHYRLWNGSAAKRYQEFEQTASEIIAEMAAYVERFHPSEQFMRCYYSKITLLFIEIIKLTYVPSANPLSRQEKISDIKRILQEDRYQEAFKRTDIRMLAPKQKFAYILLKLNFIGLVYSMYEFRQKLREKCGGMK